MSPPRPGLRVMMTTDAVGGVWVFATSLARELCRGGDRVTLVTQGPPPQEHHLQALRGVEGVAVEITDLALEWMDPEGRDFRRALNVLAAIERRLCPDIVHLNGYREACAEWTVPVLVSAHSCVGSWWRACRGGPPDEPRWDAYMANVAAGLARADRWTAPTKALRDRIEQLYAPPKPGRVIHNGIDFSVARHAKEPFILAAGRMWDEAKNLAALAEIAAPLDWPVRVAGPLRPVDGAPAPEIGLARIEILGELPRALLLAEMRRAAIFAAPARYEPFGLTVLEAAAAGCALVLSDIASFRELWAGAALMIDPADSSALRAALEVLCHDRSLRRDLQKAAADRARGYSLAAMTAGYSETYAATLAGAVPQPIQPRPTSAAEARP